jgi:hypothetical protein
MKKKKKKSVFVRLDLKEFLKNEFEVLSNLPKTTLDFICPELKDHIATFLEEKDVQNLGMASRITFSETNDDVERKIEAAFQSEIKMSKEDLDEDRKYSDFNV